METNGVLYTAHSFVRRVGYILVDTINLVEADNNRAFALLENPASYIYTTIPPTVTTSVSTPAVSTTHLDVNQKNKNIVQAVTNNSK